MPTATVLPTDINQLHALVKTLQEENRLLAEQLRFMRGKTYGSQSEASQALGKVQLALFADVEAEPVEEHQEIDGDPEPTNIPAHQRKKPGRRVLSDDLERVEVVHDLADEEKICDCGCQLKRMGEETSEQVEVYPKRAFVTRHIRPKYTCPGCEGVEANGPTVKIAPVPAQILPKTIASATLLACLLTTKYADGLPYYRQEKQFKRIGVALSRATMSSWTIQVAQKCQPILDLLEKEARSGPLIQMDETTFQVLGEKGRENTQKSYMWVARGGTRDYPVVLYKYHPSRSGQVAAAWLKDYRGVVQTDGYAGYGFLDHTEGIVHVGCWAHVRRKFAEVCKLGGKKRKPGLADQGLGMINQLYAVERVIREKSLKDDASHSYRQKHARPIVEKLKTWLEKHTHRIPPKGMLGKAISYGLKQFPKLTVYLESGVIPIDNNRVENDIRPFVVGRKNWLFAGKPDGAHASALWFSLLETAKANGWDPYTYLVYIFSSLPIVKSEKDYMALLPTRDPMTLKI